jgi:Na+/proline symporter
VRELGFDFTTTHIDMANSTVVGGVTELQIEWDGFLILIAYLAILIIIGLTGFLKKKAEKETSMEDHYLAGGGLGLLVLFFTLFASTFSGWTLMGMPGDAYKSVCLSFFFAFPT